MNAATLTSSSAPMFYIFKSPLVVAPSYEIWRKISNMINKALYIRSMEDSFTQAGLERGVRKGITSCANAIRTDNQERLNYLLTGPALKYLRERIPNIPPELLNDRLSFKEENIVSMFAYSHFISTDRLLGLTERYKPTVYTTIIAFIDKNSTEKISVRAARKRTEELLICNITFGRIFIPMGRWQISDVNFFDGKVVNHL